MRLLSLLSLVLTSLSCTPPPLLLASPSADSSTPTFSEHPGLPNPPRSKNTNTLFPRSVLYPTSILSYSNQKPLQSQTIRTTSHALFARYYEEQTWWTSAYVFDLNTLEDIRLLTYAQLSLKLLSAERDYKHPRIPMKLCTLDALHPIFYLPPSARPLPPLSSPPYDTLPRANCDEAIPFTFTHGKRKQTITVDVTRMIHDRLRDGRPKQIAFTFLEADDAPKHSFLIRLNAQTLRNALYIHTQQSPEDHDPPRP